MFKDGSGPDVNLLIVNSFRIMTIIDVRLYEFWNIVFENTNAFGFSDMRVQIVPLFYSRGEKAVFKKVHILHEVGEYFLSFVQNIWCLVRGLMEKENSVTGC